MSMLRNRPNLYQLGVRDRSFQGDGIVGLAAQREPSEHSRPAASPISSPPGGSWHVQPPTSTASTPSGPPPPGHSTEPVVYTPPSLPAPMLNAHDVPANANYQVLSWNDGSDVPSPVLDDTSLPYGAEDEFAVPYNPLPDDFE